MANELVRWMQRVGGGPSSGKALSFEDAREAMTAILSGAYHPVTFGAFLMALRWKGESVDELAGFVAALRTDALRRTGWQPEPLPGLVDVGGNYDGKVRSPVAMVAAALIAVAAGARVLLHDGTEVPTKRGVTKYHVLQALGVPVDQSPAEAASTIRRCGIGFLHSPRFNPGLHELLALRQQLGKRSFLNSVESLINPLGAEVHVGGFFHVAYGERLCRAAIRAGVGWRRVIMVQGSEGVDEIRLGRAHVAEWRDGELYGQVVRSDDLGLTLEPFRWEDAIAEAGSDGPADAPALAVAARLSSRWTETLLGVVAGDAPGAMLRAVPGAAPGAASRGSTDDRRDGYGAGGAAEGGVGEVPEAFRDAVLLNAGLLLYAAGRASSLEAGVALARETLASGTPARVLEAWRNEAVARDANFVRAFKREQGGQEHGGGDGNTAERPYAERVGWRGPLTTYPVFLIGLERRRCVIVGGGRVARDKLEQLLNGGAGRIDVISPALDPAVAELIDGEQVTHLRRTYRPGDLAGAYLVIACTDDPAVNGAVFAEAEERGVLANVVDDPPRCHFIVPAVVRRGALTVAVATGGASPALAARLRQRFERELGPEYAHFIELAGELRPLLMDTVRDPEERRRIGYALVDSEVLGLLAKGEWSAARERAAAILRGGGSCG